MDSNSPSQGSKYTHKCVQYKAAFPCTIVSVLLVLFIFIFIYFCLWVIDVKNLFCGQCCTLETLPWTWKVPLFSRVTELCMWLQPDIISVVKSCFGFFLKRHCHLHKPSWRPQPEMDQLAHLGFNLHREVVVRYGGRLSQLLHYTCKTSRNVSLSWGSMEFLWLSSVWSYFVFLCFNPNNHAVLLLHSDYV